MDNEDSFLKELQATFLEEALFLIEQCEESYLRLEDPTLRPEELSKIFRSAHSLKGAGAAVGFNDLADFGHAVEDCLTLLREHPEAVTNDLISLLLTCGDEMKKRVLALKGGDGSPWEIDSVKNMVKNQTLRLRQEFESSSPSGNAEVTALSQPSSAEAFAKSMGEMAAPASTLPATAANATSITPVTVKVGVDRIESILNIVGELLVIKSQLMTTAEARTTDVELYSVVSLLDKTVRELQDKTLTLRMTPLRNLFLRLQRTVRDLSLKLGKEVNFEMMGEDNEIDRNLVDQLADPLMHLVRNSLDHGLEKPATRLAAKKSARGTIRLHSWQAGGRVFISVSDDGAGISRERVLEKAHQRGLVPADQSQFTDTEVFKFIFSPGFSTATVVTDVSGRGVGLDVVKTGIEKMRGTIDVQSNASTGTCFTLALPLTTSITDGMLVSCGSGFFVLPMEVIRGLIEFTDDAITHLGPDRRFLRQRERMLPLLSLGQILGRESAAKVGESSQLRLRERATAVILQNGNLEFSLEVSQILGQIQVVLKPLSEGFANIPGVTGAAIMGDGRVALVLDVDGLCRVAAGFFRERPPVNELAS